MTSPASSGWSAGGEVVLLGASSPPIIPIFCPFSYISSATVPPPMIPTLLPVSLSPGFPTVVPPPITPLCLLMSPSLPTGILTFPPPLSLTQPNPGIHMDLTPSMTAIVPGFGSGEDCIDALGVADGVNDASDAGSAGGAVSVSFSAVISISSGSLSATGSVSGAGVSAERRICGVSSDRAAISASTVVFVDLAGKSPTSALRGHTAAHNATQAVMAILMIIYFCILPFPFSKTPYHSFSEIAIGFYYFIGYSILEKTSSFFKCFDCIKGQFMVNFCK